VFVLLISCRLSFVFSGGQPPFDPPLVSRGSRRSSLRRSLFVILCADTSCTGIIDQHDRTVPDLLSNLLLKLQSGGRVEPVAFPALILPIHLK
jgi:hypothetical protein